MLKRLFKFAPLALALIVGSSSVQSRDLIIELSDKVVQITTGFSGTDMLMFGAKKSEGNVIVVVRGPQEDQVVRKKERVAGVWVNRSSVEFKGLPSFYWMAANNNVKDLLPESERDIHQIGADQILLEQNPTTSSRKS